MNTGSTYCMSIALFSRFQIIANLQFTFLMKRSNWLIINKLLFLEPLIIKIRTEGNFLNYIKVYLVPNTSQSRNITLKDIESQWLFNNNYKVKIDKRVRVDPISEIVLWGENPQTLDCWGSTRFVYNMFCTSLELSDMIWQNTTPKTILRSSNTNPTKNWGELRCSGRINSSCSTNGTLIHT